MLNKHTKPLKLLLLVWVLIRRKCWNQYETNYNNGCCEDFIYELYDVNDVLIDPNVLEIEVLYNNDDGDNDS